jgi:hypothetical protein
VTDDTSLGWIQPPHRDRAHSGAYRDAFAEGRGTVVLDDFLQPEVVAAVARFLAHRATYAEERRLYSEPNAVSMRRWDDADDRDRLWAVGRPVGRRGGDGLTDDEVTYMRLRQALRSDLLGSMLRDICGDTSLGEVSEATVCSIGPGGFVRPHAFVADSCAVRVEIFVTAGWTGALGGDLVITDRHERVTRIACRDDRAVIADATEDRTFHVAPISERAAGRARNSLLVCYTRGSRSPA